MTVELGDKRAKAETELKAVTANTASDVPQEELLERRSLLEQVVRGYDEQIDNYQRLKEAGQRRADIARSSAKWEANRTSSLFHLSPRSTLVSKIRFSLRLAVEGRQSQLSLLELRFDRARESPSAAGERLRQVSGAVGIGH